MNKGIHDLAKRCFAELLEKNDIEIIRKCPRCGIDESFNIYSHITNKNLNIISKCIEEYEFEYNEKGKRADIAYIENDKLEYIFEILNTHYTKASERPEPWFELRANEIVDMYNNILTNKHYNPKIRCARSTCDCYNHEPGIIYVNQMGAGCGKTFTSIKLLDGGNLFDSKNTFIYLTKLHSAKSVIYGELKSQCSNKLFKNIVITKTLDSRKNQKQYKISFKHILLDKLINVIIGTVDSFYFAINDKKEDKNTLSMFDSIKLNIINDGTCIDKKYNTVEYGGMQIKLSDTLVILDESQDLPLLDLKVVNYMAKTFSLDFYLIGDKLQSVFGEENIYNQLSTCGSDIRVVFSEGKNIVRRFHNRKFINLVNNIVPFKLYNLPKIQDICDGHDCGYDHCEDITPYEILVCPDIYNNLGYKDFVSKIIDKLNYQVDTYGYLPNNFMFIFPVMKGNLLAQFLNEELQKYWILKFRDTNYIENVLIKNKNYSYRLDTFNSFVKLHMSDDNKPINLKESKYSTRIMSIHSSKGLGCEVVFLLGLTSSNLNSCCKDQVTNLKYNSLIHVGMTRQKMFLYVGLNKEIDLVKQRFINFENKVKSKMAKLNPESIYNDIIIDNVLSTYLMDEYAELKLINIPDSKYKYTVSWEHHVIRNFILNNIVMLNLVDLSDQSVHLTQIINKLRTMKIEYVYPIHDYYNCRKNMFYNIRNKIDTNKYILILRHDKTNSIYSTYSLILKELILNVQNKLQNNNYNFCLLEHIIFSYMIESSSDKICLTIKPKDLYDMIHSILPAGSHTNCKCNKYMTDFGIVRCNMLINHYTNLELAFEDDICIMNSYKNWVENTIGSKVKYNINYKFSLDVRNQNNHRYGILDTTKFIVGYADNAVINVIIQPDLNNLNANKILLKSILDNFVIKNDPDELRVANYHKKTIYNYIICLNHDKKKEVNNEENVINNDIKDIWYVLDFSQNTKEEIIKYISEKMELQIGKYLHNIIHSTKSYVKLANKLGSEDNKYAKKSLEMINIKIFMLQDTNKVFKKYNPDKLEREIMEYIKKSIIKHANKFRN